MMLEILTVTVSLASAPGSAPQPAGPAPDPASESNPAPDPAPATDPAPAQADPQIPSPDAVSPFDSRPETESSGAPAAEPIVPPDVDVPPATASPGRGGPPDLKDPMAGRHDPAVRKAARVYPDRPIRWRVDAFLAGGNTVIGDRGYRGVDDDRNARNLHVGARAGMRLGETRAFLSFGAGYRYLESDGDLYANLVQAGIRIQEPIFTLRASASLLDGVDLFVEPGGGPYFARVDLDSVQTARQKSVGGTFDALAGATVYLPKRWLPRRGSSRVSAGLELGLGYTWRSDLHVKPGPDTEDDPIDTQSTDLGRLSLRGFTWRAGAFVRFM